MLVSIEQIRIGSRLRSVVPARVEQLAESIAALGLQTPITVAEKVEYPSGQAQTFYLLIAGAHRLEAHRSLGLAEIEVTVSTLGETERQLWEIDENLCRADLTELEQGEHLLKRKEIYGWWRGRSDHGGDRKSQDFKTTNCRLDPAFTEDTATKTGIDLRTVQRSIRRATKIDEKVRDRIRDNPDIADSGVELDALAALDPQEQRKAVALVEAGQAGGIRDAKKLMEPKPPKVTPLFKHAEKEREARQGAFTKALWKLTPEDREWAENMLAEFFDAPVADKTSALRVVS